LPGLVTLENGKFVDYPEGEPIQMIPDTSKLRASTGVEIQVIMPVVNAPFRLIFAYNPLRVDQSFYFPWNPSNPFFSWRERAHDVKFTVGRTF
jgi:outer membrane protein assembly factor BamA